MPKFAFLFIFALSVFAASLQETQENSKNEVRNSQKIHTNEKAAKTTKNAKNSQQISANEKVAKNAKNSQNSQKIHANKKNAKNAKNSQNPQKISTSERAVKNAKNAKNKRNSQIPKDTKITPSLDLRDLEPIFVRAKKLFDEADSSSFLDKFSQKEKAWFKENLALFSKWRFELKKGLAKRGESSLEKACENGLNLACVDVLFVENIMEKWALDVPQEAINELNKKQIKKAEKLAQKLEKSCFANTIQSGLDCFLLGGLYNEIYDFDEQDDKRQKAARRGFELKDPFAAAAFWDTREFRNEIKDKEKFVQSEIYWAFASACKQGFGYYCTGIFELKSAGGFEPWWAILFDEKYYEFPEFKVAAMLCPFFSAAKNDDKYAAYLNAAYECEGFETQKATQKPVKSPKGLKYYPQSKDELVLLVADERVNLGDIDTSAITDMSFLFANHYFAEPGCDSHYEECYTTHKWDARKLADEFFGRKLQSMGDFLSVEKFNDEGEVAIIKQHESAANRCFKANAGMRTDFRGIEKWDTSGVKNMEFMFYNQKNFNADLSKWDTGALENMRGMFYGVECPNCGTSGWNLKNLKSDENAFNAPKIERVIEGEMGE